MRRAAIAEASGIAAVGQDMRDGPERLRIALETAVRDWAVRVLGSEWSNQPERNGDARGSDSAEGGRDDDTHMVPAES